jgi:UDP-glucuronate 4-epimerase
MTKTILITGIAGFIGYHTAQALHPAHKVIGLDNMNTFGSLPLKQARRKTLSSLGIPISTLDINDRPALLQLIENQKIDHIIHLAAQAGVRYSLENPALYIDSNIHGFLSILEAVRKHPHIKLIYASSSSVYGLNNKIPYSIPDRTDQQASLYGTTKKTNELMAANYHHLFNLDLTGLRFFTVYGPWGRPDMAYFSFTQKLFAGETLDLYHNGLCERDFTYIDDIVSGIQSALALPKGNHLFNLGGEKPVTVLHFLSLLEKWTGKKGQTRLLPLQKGDVIRTFADISESKKQLGFSPKVPLDEGLRRFVDWYTSWAKIN